MMQTDSGLCKQIELQHEELLLAIGKYQIMVIWH